MTQVLSTGFPQVHAATGTSQHPATSITNCVAGKPFAVQITAYLSATDTITSVTLGGDTLVPQGALTRNAALSNAMVQTFTVDSQTGSGTKTLTINYSATALFTDTVCWQLDNANATWFQVAASAANGNGSLTTGFANEAVLGMAVGGGQPAVPSGGPTYTAVPIGSNVEAGTAWYCMDVGAAGVQTLASGTLWTAIGVRQAAAAPGPTKRNSILAWMIRTGRLAASIVATMASNLQLNASRTSGVAPLSVFFDTIGTTSPLTSRPFHDLEYKWGFGEAIGPGIATWGVGARAGVSSKNKAYGPAAAHVFETPGTYTVTVSDPFGINSKTVTITVDDPEVVFAGAKTVVVSTNTDFTGADPSFTQVPNISTFEAAVALITSGNTVRRVLLHAGQTFSISGAGAALAVTGPGHIGRFGSGANPLLKPVSGFAADTNMFTPSNAGTPTMKDWRIVDLDWDGSLVANPSQGCIVPGGQMSQLTILRNNFTGVRIAIMAGDDLLAYYNGLGGTQHGLHKEWAVHDCTLTNPARLAQTQGPVASYSSYIVGDRLSYQGNNFDNDAQTGNAISHVARFPQLGLAVISNNRLVNAGGSEHSIKLHAPDQTNVQVKALSVAGVGGGYTRYIVIGDNEFTGTQNPWLVAIGPQTPGYDERVKDVIVERNFFHWSTKGQIACIVMAHSDVTVRNNVVSMTAGDDAQAFNISQRYTATPDGAVPGNSAGCPIPNNVHVYNNTIYAPDATTNFVGVSLGSNVKNTIVRDNLCEARSASGPVITSGTGDASFPLVSSNNLLNAGAGSTFVGPLTGMAGFKISTGSSAIGAGTHTTPVTFDAFENVRATAIAMDVGAHQFVVQTGSVTLPTFSTPTLDGDGATLTDFATNRVKWGTTTGTYAVGSVDVSGTGDHAGVVITGLTPGTTYYFAVFAVDTSGNLSPPSTEYSAVAV